MKTYVQNLALLSAVIAFGCQTNKGGGEAQLPAVSQDSTSAAAEQASEITIEGIVKYINYGKDGYTASIETNDNEIYYATISRANLKDAGQYRDLNTSEIVRLSGERWQLDGKNQLTVREIK